jgi:hypothetical protein
MDSPVADYALTIGKGKSYEQADGRGAGLGLRNGLEASAV